MTDRALKSTYYSVRMITAHLLVVWIIQLPKTSPASNHILVPLVHATLTHRFLFHLCAQCSHIGSCSTCAHNAHTSVLVPLVHTTRTHRFLFHLCTQRSHNGSCSTCACNTQASFLDPHVRTTRTHQFNMS